MKNKEAKQLGLTDLKTGMSVADVAKKYKKGKVTVYGWKRALDLSNHPQFKEQPKVQSPIVHDLQAKVDKAKIILAAAMNKRTLVKEIEKAAQQYEKVPSDTSDKVLITFCILYLRKIACEKYGVELASKKLEDVDRVIDLLTNAKPKEN